MSKPVLLLDLGGVLADLGDPVGAFGLEMSAAEFWPRWVNSPSVRAFETGRMQAEEFCARVADELGYTGREPFEQRFQSWQLRLFDGFDEFIDRAAADYRIALLSNTNEVHWKQVTSHSAAFGRFEHTFLSFETGYFKPDDEVFHHVLHTLNVRPGDVLFFDDSQRNIGAARALGIDAHCVSGLDGLARQVAHEHREFVDRRRVDVIGNRDADDMP